MVSTKPEPSDEQPPPQRPRRIQNVPWWAWPFVLPGVLVAIVGTFVSILMDPAGRWERLAALAVVVAVLLFATGQPWWGLAAAGAVVPLSWLAWRDLSRRREG